MPEQVQVQSWVGPGAFPAFRADAAFLRSPHLDDFRAQARSVVLGRLRLESWTLTSLVGTATSLPQDRDAIRIDFVRTGTVRYRLGHQVHLAGPGSAHLLPCSEPVAFQAVGPLDVVRLVVDAAFLDPQQQALLAQRYGPIADSGLVDALVALTSQVLLHSGPIESLPAARFTQDITAALLRELSAPAGGPLKEQIAAHVALHLTDPGLSPRSIATALGVSLRWVHRSFNDDGITIAAYIRASRCDAVARRVREDPRHLSVTRLALEYGFGGRDQLTRAFKQRFGTTVNGYRDDAADRFEGGSCEVAPRTY